MGIATILVVDDLSANRLFLVTILRHQGHRLLEAGDGQEGLAVARAERPDLVITDVLMPVMDGYEFVRQLRLDAQTSRIPVIFYTAHYGEREARALALSNGVADVLTKPAASKDVLRIVARVLSLSSESSTHAEAPSLPTTFDREHLRLLTDKLSEKAGDLRSANARLRALINIGLEIASERDPDRLLDRVCEAAHDLFGATYVTLGIVDAAEGTVLRVLTCGIEAASWIETGATVVGLLGTVITERRTVRVENPGGDPAALGLPLLHPKVQGLLATPIASPTQIYGWLSLVGNEGRSFTEDDENLVVALSGQIGRIYECGHFYSMARKRTEDLEHEILERKRVESALRDERDRAQRYLDTAQVILLALDGAGRITRVNRYACSLLGWTEDELLGRTWSETCLPMRLRDQICEKSRNSTGGRVSTNESTVMTRSGEERLIEWRNTVLCDDSGAVVGTFSSGTDITEQKKAAEALRLAEERTRFVLQSARVGVWEMDFVSGVLRWSEILEAQYGLEPGAFGGTFEDFIERIHPDDRAAMREAMGKGTKSGADFTNQFRTVWPDGTVRWLNGAGRIHLDASGEPVRGVGISVDVTERRTLEEQFQHAQKMEAIGRLAGGVAHDFNNLLTVILGYGEILLADLDQADRRHSHMEEIQKAGTRAAALTGQLLAFSRKQIIEPTLFDLNTVVEEMHTMLTRLIGEDVAIQLGLQPQPVLVKADRGQVEQVVMNLAVNARDAMPKGGTLTIETRSLKSGEIDEIGLQGQVSLLPGCDYVQLKVTDTGTGMTPQVQAHLFEPFFTTKGVGKGSGLGLATVHGIVTRCGGGFAVSSEVGRGTSFKVFLPKGDASQSASARAGSHPGFARPHTGSQTVLVVDDEQSLRELTARLLERQGYKVLVAPNAEEALQLFEQNTIDVLLTDVVMPGSSGAELASRLIDLYPHLKVIYMSGYTDEAIVQHGVLNPGIAFLQKPFTSEALGRRIRDVLDR